MIRARSKSKSRVGAAPVFTTYVPCSDAPQDVEAARKATFRVIDKSCWGASWWLEPALNGRYPEDGLAANGVDAPVIRPGDMETIRQPLDFLGFNCYHSTMIKADAAGEPEVVPYPVDYPHTDCNWPLAPMSLFYGVKFLHERYQLPIVITENGTAALDWVAVDGRVHDHGRIDYLTRYLCGYKKAAEAGVKILGYFQWSIMDNFEWSEGYHKRFGLVHVDYATQRRTLKDSAYWYRDVIASNGENLGDDPLQNWPVPAGYGRNIQ